VPFTVKPFRGLRISLLCCTLLGSTLGWGARKNPCEIITKAEAEALLGKKLEGPELSPRGTLCKYYEPGYGESPARNKLVTIGLFYSDSPGSDDVNNRRQAIIQDKSISPFTWTDLPHFADAALWEWAGGYFGALYAFRGGTLEVAVKISGLSSEQTAQAAAKKFAARALGSTSKTGFIYAAPKTLITAKDYNAPGILGPLYLGAFSQVPDDEMTRNYVLSLVQKFNETCSRVPETLAIARYGIYYEWKANSDIIRAGAKNNLDKQFQDVMEVLHRVHPHMLQEGHDDALQFLDLHSELDECYTIPVEHLYNNIAELALQRQDIPPDVDNDENYFSKLRPQLAAAYRAQGISLPNHPSLALQRSMQNVKKACLATTNGSEAMEIFCRCQVDAMKEGHVEGRDLDALSAHFSQQAMGALGTRYPEYGRRKSACYH
jgi:hypothetical protein